MKPKKLLSFLLSASIAFGMLPGCANSDEINAPVAPTESAITSFEGITNDKLVEYYSYLDSLPSESIKEVLDTPEEYTNLEVIKATYDNLKDKKIDINDPKVQQELENVVTYAAYPMGLSDEEYEQTVGTLQSTLSEMQNAYYLYYPLAVGTHLCKCDEEHSLNEFDKVVCPTILTALETVFEPTSLEDTLEDMFANDEAYLRIKEAMAKTGLGIDVYLKELENLYVLSLAPTDIYDINIWLELFGHLDATLNEEESLYETYIDIATKIHNLLYPNDSMELPEDLILLRD